MPTKKRRYTITSDEKVEFALQRSRRSFPAGTSDSKILAALVSKGEEALRQRSQAEESYEQRRRAAAKHLSDRFRQPEGFDYAALREASAQRRRSTRPSWAVTTTTRSSDSMNT
jgi:hypothetical protein